MHCEKGNKRFKLKQVLLLAFTLCLAMVASVVVYASQVKEVRIDNKGNKICVKTMAKTVGELLKETGIKLSSTDVIQPETDSILGDKVVIIAKKAPVAQPAEKNTVSLVASAVGIKPAKQNIEPKDIILKPKVTTKEKIITVKDKIPYKTKSKVDSKLFKGEKRVIKQGKPGLVVKQYKVIFRNGKEVSRKLISTKVAVKPVDKLVQEGTRRLLVTSRGDTLRFKRVIEMKATAYYNSYSETGKKPGSAGFGITATGMKTRKGVVAVDPHVIPLGSRLYIESMQNGVSNYGYSIAADTGGAIKGNIIDLFFETRQEVNDWGVRKVKVYVLE
ncbi:MAG: 3D domain-containing protein [Deltaproteobacteria bacterium]